MKENMDIATDTRETSLPAGIRAKLDALVTLLRSYGPVAIGYSGGVDSTFLAAVCARHLPAEDVLLIHLDTPLIGSPERESFERERKRFEEMGVGVALVEVNPLADPLVASNPADRCYRCKRAGFSRLASEARRRGFPTVLEGSNADDAGDFRPGMQAVKELGARSPLMETGWHKTEERDMLRIWGHEVWSLPAGACLATRIPCGEEITGRKLEVIRACEDYLHERGLRQVRVRLDRGEARVSTDADGLEALAAMSGRAAEDTAQPQGALLPAAIVEALLARGATRVCARALPYLHGETSRQTSA